MCHLKIHKQGNAHFQLKSEEDAHFPVMIL